MVTFEIKKLRVGCNFIEINIANSEGGNEVEFIFHDMPVDMINKTLDVYGISISDEKLTKYADFKF